MRTLTAFLLLTTLAWGRPHGLAKIFPANPQSVRLENLMADGAGMTKYLTMDDVRLAAIVGDLVTFKQAHLAARIPRDRAVARPETVRFIDQLDQEFYATTGKHLTVDSAVRPATVQKRLAKKNRNAAAAYGAEASTHERGSTVDLSRKMTRLQYRWLRVRLAYYQALGRIHVIEERACLHVFVGGQEL